MSAVGHIGHYFTKRMYEVTYTFSIQRLHFRVLFAFEYVVGCSFVTPQIEVSFNRPVVNKGLQFFLLLYHLGRSLLECKSKRACLSYL